MFCDWSRLISEWCIRYPAPRWWGSFINSLKLVPAIQTTNILKEMLCCESSEVHSVCFRLILPSTEDNHSPTTYRVDRHFSNLSHLPSLTVTVSQDIWHRLGHICYRCSEMMSHSKIKVRNELRVFWFITRLHILHFELRSCIKIWRKLLPLHQKLKWWTIGFWEKVICCHRIF